jgi:hypothetical protein
MIEATAIDEAYPSPEISDDEFQSVGPIETSLLTLVFFSLIGAIIAGVLCALCATVYVTAHFIWALFAVPLS